MNEYTSRWMELAEYDRETAAAMLATGRYLYVGFMCQQCIEKALKAIIARDLPNDEAPPRIHNLLKLAELAGLFAKMTAEQQTRIKDINRLYIESRYVEYKQSVSRGLDKQACTDMLKQTEELLCWIKKHL